MTAYDMPLEGRTGTMGSGEFRLSTMLGYSLPIFVQTIAPAVGGGSIEEARGSDHLTRDGVVLKGEQDIFGKHLDADLLAVLEAAGNSWSGGTWNGSVWTGNSWSGNSWSGSSWSGNSWSGNSWSGSSWSGNSWSGNSWSGSSWSGSSWSGNSWSGSSWSTAGWK
jgi:serine protease AprX